MREKSQASCETSLKSEGRSSFAFRETRASFPKSSWSWQWSKQNIPFGKCEWWRKPVTFPLTFYDSYENFSSAVAGLLLNSLNTLTEVLDWEIIWLCCDNWTGLYNIDSRYILALSLHMEMWWATLKWGSLFKFEIDTFH